MPNLGMLPGLGKRLFKDKKMKYTILFLKSLLMFGRKADRAGSLKRTDSILGSGSDQKETQTLS